MSNLIKPLIAALVLAVMVSAGFVIYTLPHWWNKVGTAAGTSRDGVIQVFSVYKSRSGEYLFVGGQANEAYIFYPLKKLVGMPGAGASQFVFVPYFAYSKDAPVAVVLSNDKIKVETDMNIDVENSVVRFTTLEGQRVEANVSKF